MLTTCVCVCVCVSVCACIGTCVVAHTYVCSWFEDMTVSMQL